MEEVGMSAPKVVWLVEGHTGQWEDHYSWIESVWSSSEAATARQVELNDADFAAGERYRQKLADWESAEEEDWDNHPGYHESSRYRLRGPLAVDSVKEENE